MKIKNILNIKVNTLASAQNYHPFIISNIKINHILKISKCSFEKPNGDFWKLLIGFDIAILYNLRVDCF